MFFHLIKIIKNCDTIIFKDISNAFKDIPFFSTHKKNGRKNKFSDRC